MKYLPTTTLTIDPVFYVWIVILATLVVIFWVFSNFASAKAKEQAKHAEGLLALKPQYGNRNFLRIISLACLGLIVFPAMGSIKANDEKLDNAQGNLSANLHQKYHTEAMKISLRNGTRSVILRGSYEGTQLISLKKGKGFDLYYLTQDKETSEPFLYASDPADGSPPLTELKTKY
jgi:hypothetical protein